MKFTFTIAKHASDFYINGNVSEKKPKINLD